MSSGLFGLDVVLSEGIDDDLYWACHSGSDEDRLIDLIRKGANINASVGKNKNMTPLIAAVSGGHAHTVQALLDRGGDVNIRAGGGTHSPTPLHVACRHGMVEIVHILLDKGAKIDPLDQDGNTPADLAGKIHHSGIIKLLNEQKMERMMQGGEITAVPRKDSRRHRRLSSDGSTAARELDEGMSSFTPPMPQPASSSSSSSSGNHPRTASQDLEMLLAAHRQLTVRESARDRQLQRIQDSVSNLQAGMHRMVTMVDGLRLLVVESLQKDEKETVKRIESTTKQTAEMLNTTKQQLQTEQGKAAVLEVECERLKAASRAATQRNEELECSLQMTKEHLSAALNDKHETKTKLEQLKKLEKLKHQKKVKNKSTSQTKEEPSIDFQVKETLAQLGPFAFIPPKTAVQKKVKKSSIGSEAKKRLERLASERKERQPELTQEQKSAKIKDRNRDKDKNSGENDDNDGGLFGNDSVDGLFDSTESIDGDNNKFGVSSTLHRERKRRPSAHHKETNVRRLSRSNEMLQTLIVDDLSVFDNDDDLFSSTKPTTKHKKKLSDTNVDDLFDFA
jgi:ankyrin repeat protein